MKIAILTTPGNWFVEYVEKLHHLLKENAYNVVTFFEHEKIDDSYEVVFILSYHRIIQKAFLLKHKHNLVVHASDLPQGKGWAPFFWQVLEGRSEIVFTLFEAGERVDDGQIYLQKKITLNGYELYDDLRKIQSETTIAICWEFLKNYSEIVPREQVGNESFYDKRSAEDSVLDINKTIAEQFNLLRTVNNEDFPAFFEIDGHRYILKIEHDEREMNR